MGLYEYFTSLPVQYRFLLGAALLIVGLAVVPMYTGVRPLFGPGTAEHGPYVVQYLQYRPDLNRWEAIITVSEAYGHDRIKLVPQTYTAQGYPAVKGEREFFMDAWVEDQKGDFALEALPDVFYGWKCIEKTRKITPLSPFETYDPLYEMVRPELSQFKEYIGWMWTEWDTQHIKVCGLLKDSYYRLYQLERAPSAVFARLCVSIEDREKCADSIFPEGATDVNLSERLTGDGFQVRFTGAKYSYVDVLELSRNLPQYYVRYDDTSTAWGVSDSKVISEAREKYTDLRAAMTAFRVGSVPQSVSSPTYSWLVDLINNAFWEGHRYKDPNIMWWYGDAKEFRTKFADQFVALGNEYWNYVRGLVTGSPDNRVKFVGDSGVLTVPLSVNIFGYELQVFFDAEKVGIEYVRPEPELVDYECKIAEGGDGYLNLTLKNNGDYGSVTIYIDCPNLSVYPPSRVANMSPDSEESFSFRLTTFTEVTKPTRASCTLKLVGFNPIQSYVKTENITCSVEPAKQCWWEGARCLGEDVVGICETPYNLVKQVCPPGTHCENGQCVSDGAEARRYCSADGKYIVVEYTSGATKLLPCEENQICQVINGSPRCVDQNNIVPPPESNITVLIGNGEEYRTLWPRIVSWGAILTGGSLLLPGGS